MNFRRKIIDHADIDVYSQLYEDDVCAATFNLL